MNQRLFGWWRCAEALASRLASPAANITRADAAACELIRESRLFAAVEAARSTVARSWTESRVRSGVEWFTHNWGASPPAGRIRQAGRCTFVAATTVLLLQAAQQAYDGPFLWVLPVLTGLAGVCAAKAAEPIARAWKARGRQ
jgi:hypothetical protein